MKRKLDLQTAVSLCKFFNQYTDGDQPSHHSNDPQTKPGQSSRAVSLHSGDGEPITFFAVSTAPVPALQNKRYSASKSI